MDWKLGEKENLQAFEVQFYDIPDPPDDFDEVDFSSYMMNFEKPLKSGKFQGSPFKISNYATNRKYWEQRMLEYLILAKAIK